MTLLYLRIWLLTKHIYLFWGFDVLTGQMKYNLDWKTVHQLPISWKKSQIILYVIFPEHPESSPREDESLCPAANWFFLILVSELCCCCNSVFALRRTKCQGFLFSSVELFWGLNPPPLEAQSVSFTVRCYVCMPYCLCLSAGVWARFAALTWDFMLLSCSYFFFFI